MAGAMVYGVTDYLHTDKKQLKHMYSDEPEVTAPVAKKAMAPAMAVEAADTDTSLRAQPDTLLTTSPPKSLNLELYSRSSLSEKYIEPDSISTQEKRTHRKRKHH